MDRTEGKTGVQSHGPMTIERHPARSEVLLSVPVHALNKHKYVLVFLLAFQVISIGYLNSHEFDLILTRTFCFIAHLQDAFTCSIIDLFFSSKNEKCSKVN